MSEHDTFEKKTEQALLMLAEAIATTARHTGYSGAKTLPDKVRDILAGKHLEAPVAPKEEKHFVDAGASK